MDVRAFESTSFLPSIKLTAHHASKARPRRSSPGDPAG